MGNDVMEASVQYVDTVQGLTPADLTELGAMLASAGLTTIQARGLVAKMQQVAIQATLAMAPSVLEEVRKVNEARLLEILTRIRALPNALGIGYISRDRVMDIIRDVTTKTPRA